MIFISIPVLVVDGQMKFYLGLHQPSDTYHIGVPYIISVKRLLSRKKMIYGDWLMDSGGFTELSINGFYTTNLKQYVEIINRFCPNGAFAQDWMCQKTILRKTGKSIREHQKLTTKSFLDLEQSIGERAIPVLQGFYGQDYIRHVEDYLREGVKLERTFGLGSVATRSRVDMPENIVCGIKQRFPKIKLHGFGLKVASFKRPLLVKNLDSADSMAWSFDARWTKGKRGIVNRNNWKVALEWREKVLNQIEDTKGKKNYQGKLFFI